MLVYFHFFLKNARPLAPTVLPGWFAAAASLCGVGAVWVFVPSRSVILTMCISLFITSVKCI
jgi:hypothetical protein